jgi:hypothetical protein
MLRRLFLDHPEAMGETYLEHQAVALSFAWPLFAASLACAVHALIPGLCTTTGSRSIVALNDRLAAGRRRGAAAFPGMYSI